MTKKGFGILGIWLMLAVYPVLAQAPDGSNPTLPSRLHGPMRLHGLVPSGGVSSENWSGYAVEGSSFTYAKGSWHVPQVNCAKTPGTYSSFWVGIDGYSDSTVEQTGTESDCSGGTAQYYAWYEFYPAGSVVISSVPVSPGDKMEATVHYSGGRFTVSIKDITTGKEFTTSKAVSGAKRTSAEWIAEAPCCTSGGGILPLADFVVANFGEDYNAMAPGSNDATDSTITNAPISAFGSAVEEITMVSSKGVTEATPTALTTDGTSFRVHWKAK